MSQKRHKFFWLFLWQSKNLHKIIQMEIMEMMKNWRFRCPRGKKIAFVCFNMRSRPVRFINIFWGLFFPRHSLWTNRKSRKMNFNVWRKDLFYLFHPVSLLLCQKRRKHRVGSSHSHSLREEICSHEMKIFTWQIKMHFITVFPRPKLLLLLLVLNMNHCYSFLKSRDPPYTYIYIYIHVD